MTPTTKVKEENFSFIVKRSYNKTVIDFNFGRHEDLSTLKVIFTSALFRVDKSSCLPKLKSIIVYYYFPSFRNTARTGSK